MKRTLIAAAGLALASLSGLAGAASWSVVVAPGVYGRVAIGGYAQPPVVYSQAPVIAVGNGPVPGYASPVYGQPPVYLWVPGYQRAHWSRYCNSYGACHVPVYFVDDRWYQDNVMRRNWTPEQRSWNQQQWLEQDRLARARWERERFDHEHDHPIVVDPHGPGQWDHDHDHGPDHGPDHDRGNDAYRPYPGGYGQR